MSKLIIATNENDILHRFWQTGSYEAQTAGRNTVQVATVQDNSVKETLSPAMDILISSNFERLLWFTAYDVYSSKSDAVEKRRQIAGKKVKEWQTSLKSQGGFSVEQKVLDAVKADFGSERVSDAETLTTIHDVYQWPNVGATGKSGYILDPHSAVSVAAALRSADSAPGIHNVALSTAHPAKFSQAVELALKDENEFQFQDILPPQFVGMDKLPKRVIEVQKSGGIQGIRKIIEEEMQKEVGNTAS